MANAYLPALDDYGDAAVPLDRLMHKNRHATCIRYATEPVQHTGFIARDRRGCRHEFIVVKKDGLHCCYCGTRSRMEPI